MKKNKKLKKESNKEKGIGKFIKKHKFIVSIVLTLIMGYLCYAVFQSTLVNTAQLVNVPVASRYLKSSTQITEEDIKYIQLPNYLVVEQAITDVNSIIGQYVDEFDSLATGSLFYEDIVVDASEVDSSSLFSLKEGEVAISIDTDVKTSYSNSINVGQYIDIYFLGTVVETKTNIKKLIYGEIVKDARVIAVKDSTGQSIDGSSESETVVVVVALKQEDAHYVELGKAMGTITPIISYDNISDQGNDTNTYYDFNKIKDIIDGHSLEVRILSDNELQDTPEVGQ